MLPPVLVPSVGTQADIPICGSDVASACLVPGRPMDVIVTIGSLTLVESVTVHEPDVEVLGLTAVPLGANLSVSWLPPLPLVDTSNVILGFQLFVTKLHRPMEQYTYNRVGLFRLTRLETATTSQP